MTGNSYKLGKRKGGIGAPKLDSCDLIISTDLKRPVEEFINKLNAGDILSIQVLADGQCIAIQYGNQVGTIICKELNALLLCISQGNSYYAEVDDVNGIRCSITIYKN